MTLRITRREASIDPSEPALLPKLLGCLWLSRQAVRHESLNALGSRDGKPQPVDTYSPSIGLPRHGRVAVSRRSRPKAGRRERAGRSTCSMYPCRRESPGVDGPLRRYRAAQSPQRGPAVDAAHPRLDRLSRRARQGGVLVRAMAVHPGAARWLGPVHYTGLLSGGCHWSAGRAISSVPSAREVPLVSSGSCTTPGWAACWVSRRTAGRHLQARCRIRLRTITRGRLSKGRTEHGRSGSGSVGLDAELQRACECARRQNRGLREGG